MRILAIASGQRCGNASAIRDFSSFPATGFVIAGAYDSGGCDE
jgi:hypothetical protein